MLLQKNPKMFAFELFMDNKPENPHGQLGK